MVDRAIVKIIRDNGGPMFFRCFIMLYDSDIGYTTWRECCIELLLFNINHSRTICFYPCDIHDNILHSITLTYQQFYDGIKTGDIIVKTDSSQHIDRVKWAEPLSGNILLISEADVVI